MDNVIGLILILLLVVSLIIYFILWVNAVSDLKKPNILVFFKWYYLFFPGKFNERGNVYRKKSLISVIFFVSLVIVVVKYYQ